MTDIKIPEPELIQITQIRVDDSNPNTMNQQQFDSLKHVIKTFGFIVPVILNKDNVICDGFHRYKAARELGLNEVLAIKLQLEEVDRKILRQVLNKLRGKHKFLADVEEFRLINEEGKWETLVQSLGENEANLLKIRDYLLTKVEEDDFDVNKALQKPKYNIKIGELWQLGRHRLLCGDCRSNENIKRLVAGNQIDLILTDPPYGINIVKKDGKVGTTSNIGFVSCKQKTPSRLVEGRKYLNFPNDNPEDIDPSFLLKHSDNVIIFGANYFAHKLPPAKRWLVWDKKKEGGLDHNNFSDVELAWTSIDKVSCLIYRHLWSGLLREGNRKSELKKRVHPTQKPVGLMGEIIKDHIEQGQIIFDGFGGSGTTLIACEQLEKDCYMMELDPNYASVIIERWEQFTGEKPIKVEE